MFSEHSTAIRPPAVAGQFYPRDADQLTRVINDMLRQASPPHRTHVKALIAPHAGYVYSGPVAASVYRSLADQAGEITRVVLLGPSHHVAFSGLAVSSAEFFQTPLGNVTLDRAAAGKISDLPQVTLLDEAHVYEHSLEVQIPFLQRVLTDFTLLPIVVGDASAPQVAEVLERVWGGNETLIVISSDLSHYLSYQAARERDQRTSAAILNLRPEDIQYHDACGRNPVNGLLLAARRHKLTPVLADLRNSGDTAGPRDRVVGYGGYLFSDDD